MTGTDRLLDHLSQSVLDLLPAAVFVATVPNGDIIGHNRRAAELCLRDGFSPRPLWECLHAVGTDEAPVAAAAHPIAIALKHGRRLHDVEAIFEAARTRIAISVSIEPIEDGAGRPITTLTLCQPTHALEGRYRCSPPQRAATHPRSERGEAWRLGIRPRDACPHGLRAVQGQSWLHGE